MITSKFKIWQILYLSLLAICYAFILSISLLGFFIGHKASDLNFFNLFVILIFGGFLFLWFLGELRTKAISISINTDQLTKKGYYGLGIGKRYLLNEFDGFEVTKVSLTYLTWSRTYEYLYLIKKGKRVVKISEYYHNNYKEIKDSISRKLKFLGKKPYNYFQIFREFFD